jgi:hypothetical protein
MDGPFFEELPPGAPPRDEVSYGPDGSLLDNLTAAYYASAYQQPITAKRNALLEARKRRRKQIEEATGQDFGSAIKPYMDAAIREQDPGLSQGPPDLYQLDRLNDANEEEAVKRLKADLTAQGRGQNIATGAELTQRAHELTLDAAAQEADTAQRSPGFGASVARMVGGVGGFMTDPASLLMAGLGAAPETGIAATMAIEGGLAGATSVAALPFQNRWRTELGLEPLSGSDQASQVIADTVIAAATAGVIKGAARGLGKLVTPRQAVEAFDRAFPEGDAPKPLRDTRDALDGVAQLAEDNPLPETPAGEAEHVRRTIMADQAVRGGEPLPRFAEDPPPGLDLTTPVRQQLLDEAASAKPKRVTHENPDIVEFLRRRGGIKDTGGELKARDLHLYGRLARKGGITLSDALELARDHGYLHDASGPNPSKLTETDLLDAIDRNERGQRVYPFNQDAAAVHADEMAAYTANLDHINKTLDEVSHAVTDPLPAHVKRRAAELRMTEPDLAAADALERSILEDYHANPEQGLPDLTYDDGHAIPFPDSSRAHAERGGAGAGGGGGGRSGQDGLSPPEGQPAQDAGGAAPAPDSPALSDADPLPDPARMAADLEQVPEPLDHAARAEEMAAYEDELAARRAEDPEAIDAGVLAATDGEFATFDDLMADFARDRDFLESVKLCLT